MDLRSGEELTAQELGTAAFIDAATGSEYSDVAWATHRMGCVRLTPGGPWHPIACVFPEKAGASCDARAGGTARAPAEVTLREWLASRGSEAISNWCLDVGVTSLAALVRVDDTARAAAATVQANVDDVPPGFGQAFEELAVVMKWA